MVRGKITTIAVALMGTAAFVGAAQAGGFSRGSADTDILYEEGNFNMRAGATIVAPSRAFETINGVAASDDEYSDSYVIPSAAYKINLTDDARCAGTYTTSFGGDATYGNQAIIAGLADGTGTAERHFSTNEFGMTCGYKFNVGPGRAWLIGGLYMEDFSYSETVRLASAAQLAGGGSPLAPFGGAFPTANSGTLSFDGDYEFGYRIGAAFEVPEIALRAQLMYRSEITHNPAGNFRFFDTATGATLFGGAAVLPTLGNGTLPQSVELKVQSGIMADTLAFASVKWTDWSVLQTLNYAIFTPAPVNTRLEYFWQDGWTVSAGIGRKFNDTVSGQVSLTWDQGVSTTEDVFTDTWTLATGASVKDQWGGEFRAGVAVSYLSAGSVNRQVDPRGGPGDTFAYTVGSDWSLAGGAGYSIKW